MSIKPYTSILALVLAACGGGGSDLASIPVTVDSGPASSFLSGHTQVNSLYATITVCVPSTNTCQTVDHVIVDTGSVGVRLASDAMQIHFPATTDRACAQFASGNAYGSVVQADVTIAGRTARVPVQIMGDQPPSASCPGQGMASSLSLGANGVLGVGPFSDCEGCLTNPVAAMGANGVTIDMPSIPDIGTGMTAGTMSLGIEDKPATWMQLDRNARLKTVYRGKSYTAAIDSGAGGLFFPGCCVNGSDSAQIVGADGSAKTVSFTLHPLDREHVAQMVGQDTAGLSSGDTFIWGMPFFYGRKVSILMSGKSVGGIAGPAVGF